MQNNIIKIIQILSDSYELCNTFIDFNQPNSKLNCQKIMCSNCPLKENNPFINRKYGDSND